MKNPAFVFDDVSVSPDRQISLHAHRRWELSHVIVGSGTRTVGDRTEPIHQGEIVLIPPDIPHVWRFDPAVTDNLGRIANISVFFEPELLDGMAALFPELDDPINTLRALAGAISFTGDARTRLSTILLAMRSLTPAHRFPLMAQLLLALSDTSGSHTAGNAVPLSRTERRLEAVRVYCACNYRRPITLDELAAHTGMNRSAFCTFMRRHAGSTLSEYVNGVRLDRAREKLTHTDATIAEIALDCGFQSVTYFNRLFRARYGCTPRTLRLPQHI